MPPRRGWTFPAYGDNKCRATRRYSLVSWGQVHMADSKAATASGHGHGAEETRRDFLIVATGALGAIATAGAVWPFIHQMNPSADVLALSSPEIDISSIKEGQATPAVGRGKPVFI